MHFLLVGLDILIVAALVYTVLQLLKRTQSIFIFRGIVSLLVIYLLAFYLKLELTVAIFQFFLSFFIIILVVIFQREFRRFFENFSLSSVRKVFFARSSPEHSRTVQTIEKSVRYFMDKKIGALLVLPGDNQIDRYIEGGNELDGKLSSPLLKSIFDPSSPGHDGAAIIGGEKVMKFGVHLPLADNFRDVKEFGTRHRAGLGLAERTDALVIIVSEEKGTVSIAQNGRIVQIEIEQLAEKVGQFADAMAKKSDGGFWYRIFLFNAQDRLIALGIAILLWFSIIGK